MKKTLRIVCIMLVISLALAMPAQAEGVADTRASAFFSGHGASLYKTSATTFQIWFDVDSNVATMQRIGVSSIEVYRSSNQSSWTLMKTYDMDDYPGMTDYNTSSHTGYVTYSNATPGYYYTAYVVFYAKNSSGVGETDTYTAILRM